MALPVVYRPKVGRDLAGGFGYYEGQAQGLGEQFLSAVNSAFDAIERYPEMFGLRVSTAKCAAPLFRASRMLSSTVSNPSAGSYQQSCIPLVIRNSGHNRKGLRANSAMDSDTVRSPLCAPHGARPRER